MFQGVLMSNVQWRRIVVLSRKFIEGCNDIAASDELQAETERLSALLEQDELVAIPRIYLDSPKVEFKELPVQLNEIYREIMSNSKRLARVIEKMEQKT